MNINQININQSKNTLAYTCKQYFLNFIDIFVMPVFIYFEKLCLSYDKTNLFLITLLRIIFYIYFYYFIFYFLQTKISTEYLIYFKYFMFGIIGINILSLLITLLTTEFYNNSTNY